MPSTRTIDASFTSFYRRASRELVSTHWEEQILPTGRTWRVFYWTLNMDKIRKAVQPIAEEHVPELGIYKSLRKACRPERPSELEHGIFYPVHPYCMDKDGIRRKIIVLVMDGLGDRAIKKIGEQDTIATCKKTQSQLVR